MVFKDVEGTKQARKELAEKESKILLSLQGNKPSKPQPKPEPKPESSHSSSLLEIINVKLGDYEAFFKDEFTNSDFDAEVEILSDPMFLPKADYPSEVNQLQALLEAEMDVIPTPPSYYPYMNLNSKSPVYLAYKKKMMKVHKRKLLKSLIKKHGTKPVQLSMVDNSMTDDQVDEMILTCLKLEQVQGELAGMPSSDPFGDYGY